MTHLLKTAAKSIPVMKSQGRVWVDDEGLCDVLNAYFFFLKADNEYEFILSWQRLKIMQGIVRNRKEKHN